MGAASDRGALPAMPPATMTPAPTAPLDLDPAAAHWQLALDAAGRALAATHGVVHLSRLQEERQHLVLERAQAALLLARLARTTGARAVPWLSPFAVTPRLLGLGPGTRGCLFDLDGVLTDSGVLHAHAWAEAFDPFLLRVSERTGWQFIPFDRESDYRAFLDGRPRLDGVHAFLASRGIHLPEGHPGDPADAETAHGLARRKSDATARALERRGLSALAGARHYLEAAGHAGLGRAVVSASTRTQPMLELVGLETLIEERIDADVIRDEGLRPRPAPDLLLVACERLGVPPGRAVTFTDSPAGIAAANAAGLRVIGVATGARAELLRGFGAERVFGSLASLLDPRLAALVAPPS